MTKTCSQCAILFILILIQDCRCPRLLSIGPSWQVWWCDRSIENEHHPSHIWSFVRDVGMWVVSPCVPTVSWFALDRRNLRCPRMIYLHICTQADLFRGLTCRSCQNRAVLDGIKGGLDEIQLHEVGGRTTHKRAVTCLWLCLIMAVAKSFILLYGPWVVHGSSKVTPNQGELFWLSKVPDSKQSWKGLLSWAESGLVSCWYRRKSMSSPFHGIVPWTIDHLGGSRGIRAILCWPAISMAIPSNPIVVIVQKQPCRAHQITAKLFVIQSDGCQCADHRTAGHLELWPFGTAMLLVLAFVMRGQTVSLIQGFLSRACCAKSFDTSHCCQFLSIVYRGLSVAFHGKKHLKTWPSPGKVDLIVPASYQSRLQETSKFWESEPTSLKQIHPPIGFAQNDDYLTIYPGLQ